MIDGSSVNVIPASSGVSSSAERNGRSWTSRPIPWPIRWRKCSPSPASSIGPRQAAFDLARERARPAGGASRLGGGEHHVVRVQQLGARLARDDRAAEVGAVAVDDAAEVEEDGRVGGQRVARPSPSPESRLSASKPVKMCVANEGVSDPARRSWSSTSSRSSAIVTPGTTCGATAAIACSTVRHARPIAVELLVGLHAPELVDERRAGSEPLEAEDRGRG